MDRAIAAVGGRIYCIRRLWIRRIAPVKFISCSLPRSHAAVPDIEYLSDFENRQYAKNKDSRISNLTYERYNFISDDLIGSWSWWKLRSDRCEIHTYNHIHTYTHAYMNEPLTDWLTDWMTDWLSHWVRYRYQKLCSATLSACATAEANTQ